MNTFINESQRAVGTSPVGVYACPNVNDTTAVVIGLTVANVSGVNVTMQVSVETGAGTTNITAPSTPLPVGSSLIVAGGEQKIVLSGNDRIMVSGDTNGTLDVFVSVLEMDNQ